MNEKQMEEARAARAARRVLYRLPDGTFAPKGKGRLLMPKKRSKPLKIRRRSPGVTPKTYGDIPKAERAAHFRSFAEELERGASRGDLIPEALKKAAILRRDAVRLERDEDIGYVNPGTILAFAKPKTRRSWGDMVSDAQREEARSVLTARLGDRDLLRDGEKVVQDLEMDGEITLGQGSYLMGWISEMRDWRKRFPETHIPPTDVPRSKDAAIPTRYRKDRGGGHSRSVTARRLQRIIAKQDTAYERQSPGDLPKGIPDYSGTKLKVGSGAGGSTGARWAFDESGQRWLSKVYRGHADRVATELLANAVYREMGADVAPAGRTTMDYQGKQVPALVYPTREGKMKQGFGPSKKLAQHYMTDALVANHDYIGLVDDNIIWQGDDPIRLDQGGAFEFRAQGKPKDYGPEPLEVKSMLTIGQAKGRIIISDEDKRAQAAEIAKRLTPERIDELVNAAGFRDKEMRERVRHNLKQRVAWMGEYAKGNKRMSPGDEVDYKTDIVEPLYSLLDPADGEDLVNNDLGQFDEKKGVYIFPGEPGHTRYKEWRALIDAKVGRGDIEAKEWVAASAALDHLEGAVAPKRQSPGDDPDDFHPDWDFVRKNQGRPDLSLDDFARAFAGGDPESLKRAREGIAAGLKAQGRPQSDAHKPLPRERLPSRESPGGRYRRRAEAEREVRLAEQELLNLLPPLGPGTPQQIAVARRRVQALKEQLDELNERLRREAAEERNREIGNAWGPAEQTNWNNRDRPQWLRKLMGLDEPPKPPPKKAVTPKPIRVRVSRGPEPMDPELAKIARATGVR